MSLLGIGVEIVSPTQRAGAGAFVDMLQQDAAFERRGHVHAPALQAPADTAVPVGGVGVPDFGKNIFIGGIEIGGVEARDREITVPRRAADKADGRTCRRQRLRCVPAEILPAPGVEVWRRRAGKFHAAAPAAPRAAGHHGKDAESAVGAGHVIEVGQTAYLVAKFVDDAADDRKGDIPGLHHQLRKLSAVRPMPQDNIVRGVDDMFGPLAVPRFPCVHPDGGGFIGGGFLIAREKQIDDKFVRRDNTVAVLVKSSEVKAGALEDAGHESDFVFMRFIIIAAVGFVAQQTVGMLSLVVIGGSHSDLDDIFSARRAEVGRDDTQLSVRLVEIIAADGMLRAPYLRSGIVGCRLKFNILKVDADKHRLALARNGIRGPCLRGGGFGRACP